MLVFGGYISSSVPASRSSILLTPTPLGTSDVFISSVLVSVGLFVIKTSSVTSESVVLWTLITVISSCIIYSLSVITVLFIPPLVLILGPPAISSIIILLLITDVYKRQVGVYTKYRQG